MFFWLLTNRMAPPAVFLLPFFQLYSAVGLFDTHLAVALAHCCSTCRWRSGSSKASCSGVPREIDETAYIDGYSFPRFFVRDLPAADPAGIGVAAFFCFMFSWVELLLARTLTTINAKPIAATMTRTVSAAGMDWGVLAAAGVLTHRARRARDLVRAQLHRQGLRPGPRLRRGGHGHRMDGLDAGRRRCSSSAVALMLVRHDGLADPLSRSRARTACCPFRRRAATGCSSSLLGAAYMNLAWIGFVGADTIVTLPIADGLELSSLWLASLISLVYAAAVFRWV